ncbi:MAG: hypothetical protein Q7J38_02740 [Gallionella sp.]|nr:hypothetical protein [Gallionella sp.]
MSITTMSMSEYEIEQNGSMAEGYSDEVLCAGWNPALALQQHAYTERGHASAMPPELASVDVEQFLKKMYAYQR